MKTSLRFLCFLLLLAVTTRAALLNNTVAQGSTTSGQTGPLVQGAVTTSSPSYVTGQTSPFSLTAAGALRVDGSGVTQPVSGAFWQAIQPVSGTFWQGTQPVSGTFWQATQPISASSLPLPSGASTAAKQPALGTAGSPSADVITVQGTASMTAIKVDGSGVTQPVSGTVATTPPANASTNIAQLAGTTTDVNSGNKSAGTQRVVIATDQPSLNNALKVDTSGTTASTVAATLVSGTRAPAAIATPEALTTTTLVHSVVIRAGRTARVANTGSVWIGTSSTNDTQLIELVPGATMSFTAPPGKYIDLAGIYVDAVTLTDGVVYVATQ